MRLDADLSATREEESRGSVGRGPPAALGALKFATGDRFQGERRRRVNQYFSSSGSGRRLPCFDRRFPYNTYVSPAAVYLLG
jgi:hypothetical protein